MLTLRALPPLLPFQFPPSRAFWLLLSFAREALVHFLAIDFLAIDFLAIV
jgi:hypothetical protein